MLWLPCGAGWVMRVLMSLPAVPHHTGGGVAESSWATLQELRRRGHQVLVLTEHASSKPAVAEALRETGAEHAVAAAAERRGAVEAWQPDAIYALSVSSIVPFNILPQVPRLCVVGDLDHQVPLYRRLYYVRAIPLNYPELTNLHARAIAIKAAVFPQLKQCHTVVASCRHHSVWLESQGIHNEFIPAPGVDPRHKGWVRPLDSYHTNPWPRISMAGHLEGIATLSGLYFLAEDVMPWLMSDQGMKCEIRIAGAERLYHDLATRLMPYLEPSGPVTLLGYVEDIQAEMMQSEICLVTTPIDLGVRTRIIDAMALGCCLVIHKANLVGFAEGELVPGENCLIGKDGAEIAAALQTAADDRDLRIKLGQSARQTFEQYHLESAAKTVDLIERTLTTPGHDLPVGMKAGKDMLSGIDPRNDADLDVGRAIKELDIAFHGDPVLLGVIDSLVQGQGLKFFVETGAEVGTGTLHMAQTYPHLRCYTCEPHLPTYKRAMENLKEVRSRVSVFAGTSEFFFERFVNQMPDVLEQPALFWLDAHSHGYGCPLPEEVAFVTKNWSGGYILIDDCQVPGHPEFGYDIYKTGAICWDMIQGSLASERVRQVWWPSCPAAPYPTGRGWVLLTFGEVPDWAPPPDLEGQLWQTSEIRHAEEIKL